MAEVAELALFEDTAQKTKKGWNYAQGFVTYKIQINADMNKALIEYQANDGFSKTAAIERLVIAALKHLGLLDAGAEPYTVPTNVTGRKPYKEGSVLIVGKMSVAAHNALMTWKLNDPNLKHDTKPMAIQKLIIIGFRLLKKG